ncbi:MAG: NPCBM/NEW2 domain-containing protein [Colwellia sp.]
MPFNNSRVLLILYSIIILASALLIGADGHNSDIGCWFSWTKHLQAEGYAGLNANYPPLYIHWLWLVGQWYSITGLLLQNDLLFKIFAIFPVIIAHLFIMKVCYTEIRSRVEQPILQWILSLGIALNPAILFNGVVWGQVDVLPAAIILLSFKAIKSPFEYSSLALTCIALLCKFQMLVFLPILCGHYILHPKKLIRALPLAALCVALILTPYIVSENTENMITRAYIDAPSKYPYSTMNGANIWMVLTKNKAPDSKMVTSDTKATTLVEQAATPKGIGMILFGFFSLWFFIRTIQTKSKENMYGYSVILAVIFFLFSSGMHERYLFAAVPISFIWASYSIKRIYIPLLLSFICYANMHLVIEIESDWLWTALSSLLIGLFFAMITPEKIKMYFMHMWLSLLPSTYISTKAVSLILLGILLSASGIYSLQNTIVSESLDQNERWVFDLKNIESSQGYKKRVINKSVMGNFLQVQDTIYLNGIGSHAPSTFTYKLPHNATRFTAYAAIDDEAPKASVTFKVYLDSTEVWNSGHMRSGDPKRFCSIPVNNNETIRLEMDEGDSKKGDHANWLMPKIQAGS